LKIYYFEIFSRRVAASSNKTLNRTSATRGAMKGSHAAALAG